ncbi:hypothetical protein [Nonomuraea sp. JJY05]|jgi:hypothetical protein|uniref:hypothetical protein n=1 Tax=Nonomuraea sp. JJY05 TaxID=3350255 RepID=UPI00373EC2E5
MDRRKAGLAAGMVLVLMMGGSGALAASSRRDPAGDPCAKAAACTPDDLAKAKAAKAAELDGKCSPGVKGKEQPKPVESGALAKALAASLGVGLDRAKAAEEELNLLSQKGGINPKSPEFAAIAERLGVSAERLIQALEDFKRSFVREQDAVEKKPGS